MPHWIFARDEKGTVHQMGGHFVSETSAQAWIDSCLKGNEDPEIFYSPHYDAGRVTKEWKKAKKKLEVE